MDSLQAFLAFRDNRRVEEGLFPRELKPWIFAKVSYEGVSVDPIFIEESKIRYIDTIYGIEITIEALLQEFDYFADFRTSSQKFEYDEVNDRLTITGSAYHDPKKIYKVVLE